MATIGEMLHMDDEGRFTTSGTGEGVAAEFERRREEAEARDALDRLRSVSKSMRDAEDPDTQVTLRDSGGGLCGYYAVWQTWDMPETLRREGNLVRMAVVPTVERRLALLRRSFANPSLTPEQNQEISQHIDSLIHPRNSKKGQRKESDAQSRSRLKMAELPPNDDSSNARQPKKPRSEFAPVNQAAVKRLDMAASSYVESDTKIRPHELLITRDSEGLFLGQFSIAEARRRWPSATRSGDIIYVKFAVPFAMAFDTVYVNTEIQASHSKRIASTLDMARQYIKNNRYRHGASVYWKDRQRFCYNVYLDDEVPICCVPLSSIERSFGKEWIIIGSSQIQLLGSWNTSEIASRINKALRLAKREYYEVAEVAGDPCLTEVQFMRRERKKAKAKAETSKPSSRSRTSEVARHYISGDIRHATRDINGCFLGVFTYDEAKAKWSDVQMASAMLVVPHTVPFQEAAAALDDVTSFETSFNMRQYKDAIAEASSFVKDMANQEAGAYWLQAQNKAVAVRNNSRDVIGFLTPKELTRAFETGWFMVTPDSAQIMINMGAGVVATKVRMAERLSLAPTAASASKPKRKEKKYQSTQSRQPAPEPALIMSSIGVSQEHARAILGQIRIAAQHGYRTKLIEMINRAFPGESVALPSGMTTKQYHIAGVLAGTGQHKLSVSDIEFVLKSIDEAMTRDERQKEDARAAYDELMRRAQMHKHAVISWTEAILASSDTFGPERELARVFSERRGTVLVMPDGELYRSVLNTDMDDEAYWSSLRFIPFTHFIVRTPRIGGVYGFGVVADDDRGSAVLIPIPDGKNKVKDARKLDK